MVFLSLTFHYLCVGRSNVEPLLDEEDTESDTPLPNRIVIEGDDTHTLRQITGSSSLANWAKRNVGDMHIGKRKQKAAPRKKKGKKQQVTDEPLLASDESNPSPDEGRSPPYQSSNLSTSASSDDDDNGGDDGGYQIEPSQHVIQFTSTNLHSFFSYYFPYFSNSCTSFLKGVTLHSCHSGQGS
jgi:hypothetical protein